MRTLLASTAVFGLFVSFLAPAAAQQAGAGANASRYGIAVVDVSYIFKNYAQFRQTMDTLKAEMEQEEGKLKSKRDVIQGKEEQRKQYNPGSPEYKALDEDLARMKSDFNLEAGKVRKEFLEREAKAYYQTYTEVSNAVKYFAQNNNIGLVLRFNGDPVDPNRRDDVLRAINKPVVHQASIDITPDVLALLNGGGGAGGVAPAASAGAAQRR